MSVRVRDAEQATAVDILDDEGSVDLDERQESWCSSGWSGSQASGPDGDLSASGAEASEASRSEEVVPLAEERLRVGKRDVEHGRVRVRSYIIEEPVNEDVTLRRERVSLERRPVDKPAGSGADPFRSERWKLPSTQRKQSFRRMRAFVKSSFSARMLIKGPKRSLTLFVERSA